MALNFDEQRMAFRFYEAALDLVSLACMDANAANGAKIMIRERMQGDRLNAPEEEELIEAIIKFLDRAAND